MYVSNTRKPLVYVSFSDPGIEERFWGIAGDILQRASVDDRGIAHQFSFNEKIVFADEAVVRNELRIEIRKLIEETYNSTGVPGRFEVTKLNIDTDLYRDYHIDGDLVRSPNPLYREHTVVSRQVKRFNRFGDSISHNHSEPKYGRPFLRMVRSEDGVIISPLDRVLFEPTMMADTCDFIASFYVGEGVRHRKIADHRFGFNYEIEVKLIEGSNYDCVGDLEDFLAEVKMNLGVRNELS